MKSLPALLVLTAGCPNGEAIGVYRHDPTWKPHIPPLPPLGAGHLYSAVAVLGDEVFISQRGNYSEPIAVLDRAGRLLRGFGKDVVGLVPGGDGFGHTWGGHGLAVQRLSGPNCFSANFACEDRIWVMDCVKFQVHSFSPNGTHIKSAGRKGYGADEFGCVADATFHNGIAYFADGDAADDNRVEAWTAASGVPEKPLWTSEPAGAKSDGRGLNHLSWPHSITWHDGLGKLLVADRGAKGSPTHSRIVVMDPETGKIGNTLNCTGLDTPHGHPAPFGVRALRTPTDDLLFVAVADVNPQDGKTQNQWINIIDASRLSVDGTCKTLQRVNFLDEGDPSKVCETPHLMGIDHKNFDVYMACVAVAGNSLGSRVVRITQAATSTSTQSAIVV